MKKVLLTLLTVSTIAVAQEQQQPQNSGETVSSINQQYQAVLQSAKNNPPRIISEKNGTLNGIYRD